MRLGSCSLICWLALAAGPAAAQPSPACKPVIDATHKQSTTPNHMVVVRSGHPNADVINLPDATYVRFPQGWLKTGPGFNDDPPDLGDNLPTFYECRQLPDDALDGAAANVFAVHIVRDTKASDGTIWIAKATGLPIKSESNATVGGRRAHLSSTWSYDNIHAPVVK
jgi:hypothetical protein